jgi:hypothetical protein
MCNSSGPVFPGVRVPTSLHTSARLPLAVLASPSSRSSCWRQSPSPVLSLCCLSVCLSVCLHLTSPHLTSPHKHHRPLHTPPPPPSPPSPPLDILPSARQYQYIPARNHLPNLHQRSGGRARPAPFSPARQLASRLAIHRPHPFTTRHHQLRLITSNGFE